jgi:uncharacterized protein involved in outer membrane biogenesis
MNNASAVMTARPTPVRIILWTLVALSAMVSLVLVIATLALPGWIAGRGVMLASDMLGRPVSVEQAHFQPWRLAVVLDGLRVGGSSAGQPPLLTLTKLDAALSLRSLLRGHAVLESLALTRPELRIARIDEGRYDIDDLLQHLAARPGAPQGADAELAVYNIELTEGRVLFEDRPVQRKHELADLRLALPFVSTVASDVQVKVLPQLSGKLDGVAFDGRAEALPFKDDASARLSFKLAGLDLAHLAAYVPQTLPLRLAGGRLDLDLSLDFAERPSQPPSVKLSGRLQLHELSLTQPDGKPLLALKRLSLPLVDAQPLRRQLGFGPTLLESPSLWLQHLPVPTTSVASGNGGTVGAPWQINLAGLEVKDGRLEMNALALQAIELKLAAASWPLTAPTRLDASLRLGVGKLSTQISLSPEALDAVAQLQSLPIDSLAAWLPLPASARLAAAVSTTAALSLRNPLADGAAGRTRLSLSDVQINDLRFSLAGKPLLTVASAHLEQADIDPAGRSLRLGTLKLDAPRAQLGRSADGRINLAPLLPGEQAASAADPAWKLQLKGLQIEGGALRWRDAAVPAGFAPVALAVEPLRVQASAIAWPAGAPVQAQLTAQVAALGANDLPVGGSAGTLQWSGRVGLAPLSASGSLQAQALPLQLLSAYLDPTWGLHLQRAELGMKAEFDAARLAGGAWQAVVGGDVRIGPLALLQTRLVDGQRVVGEDLLSWQALRLDGLKLALAPGTPPRLAVRDAQLDEAYARLIVDEQGRFNLRDIGPAEAASAPVAAVAASAPQTEFAVDRILVNRSTVDFSDRFVKPGYSARLTELQGSLGAFSSSRPAMAPLTLRGKVAGTGLLEVDGQLKPGAPLSMDVQANATDIELAPLSGYAGKYVGYAIERGKLSARLNYQIEPGGQLMASNQIILNQLTFGDRVESAEATSLPVRFAAALLKDGNGVIDVNLPVSGSLSDPEFSVTGLVWKLFLQLVGKALTSPFSLLTGSDSTEAAEIVFAPASAEPDATYRLDAIARQLADKAGVQLTLTGWADAESEVTAIREQRLAMALKGEVAQRANLSPEAALKRLYEATQLPNKPRNVIGQIKDLPPAQMRGLLMASYEVDDEALRQLAVARAVAVRDALLVRGAPNARVFLAAPKLCNGACASGWRPHVEMSLAAH